MIRPGCAGGSSPGGTREALLRELGRRPYHDWILSEKRVLLRPGHPGVAVDVRQAGDDLVVELRIDAAIDVDAGLRQHSR